MLHVCFGPCSAADRHPAPLLVRSKRSVQHLLDSEPIEKAGRYPCTREDSVDELPVAAFLDKRRIPIDKLTVDVTVGLLFDLVEKMKSIGKRYEGTRNYTNGKALLDEIGPILDDVFAQVEIDDSVLPVPPDIWLPEQVFEIGYFWLPHFLTIAEQEWQAWRHGWQHWPPRISLSGTSLRMLWRKNPWAKLPSKLIALDATSVPGMYERIFTNGHDDEDT